jgi:hypothetical protein
MRGSKTSGFFRLVIKVPAGQHRCLKKYTKNRRGLSTRQHKTVKRKYKHNMLVESAC